MKRNLMFILLLSIGLLWIAGDAWSVPTDESLRSQATAGMFKHDYDRLADNPAYLGAPLTYLDYEGSLTKEKDQLFTTTDGLNDNGRFIAGGIGLFSFGGVGGYVELGTETTSEGLHLAPGVSNTGVNLTGMQGSGEATDVYLTGPGTYYNTRETLNAEEESYTNDGHINAKAGVGGINLGILTCGARFERNTDVMYNNIGYGLIDDVFGSGTGETTDKGNYGFVRERLTDGYVDYTTGADFDNTTTRAAANYLFGFGIMMPMDVLVKTLEAELMVGYLSYERTVDNSGTGVSATTGADVVTTDYYLNANNLKSDECKSSALEYGLKVQTREDILDWSATTFISWMGGGLSPYKDRTIVYRDFTYVDYPALPDYIDDTNTTGTQKYEGDGLSMNQIQAGIQMRKKKQDLLMGFGFVYSMQMWEDKSTLTSTYRQVIRSNDADGAVDADDYTQTITGSYEDKYTRSGQAQTFELPIAFEYQATPTLCWRIGATHTTVMTAEETKRERSSASDLYRDVDSETIPGNETDGDGLVNPSTGIGAGFGGYSFNTESRGDREYQKESNQYNSYSLGLGYKVMDPLSIDILWWQAYSDFTLNNSVISMSLTYIF